MIKVAYGSIPKDGGTFTFYRNQRPSLLKLGIELICVTVGYKESNLWNSNFADDGCILLAKTEKNLKKQSQIFVKWCVENDIEIVVGVNSEAIISSIPHLPTNIRVVSRAANAFHEGYMYATHSLYRISKVVALVPLLHKDLVEKYQVPEQIIEIIPNGVDLTKFEEFRLSKTTSDPLKILFVGRLEHNQKGVLHIPKILDKLDKKQIPYQLTIVGKGKHEDQLRNSLSPTSQLNVNFLGTLESKKVIEQLYQHDIFLFTSHFEGCPNALLEALVAGCVPVAWNLPGITDFLIQNNQTGFLHSMNHYDGMADSIEKLSLDRNLLGTVSQNAIVDARKKYSNEVCAAAYAQIFYEVLRENEQLTNSDWHDFKPVAAQRLKLDFIPDPLRNILKRILGK